MTKNTVDSEEISRFNKVSDKWWDESGPFAPLHQMNPTRISYIRDHIATYHSRNPQEEHPLKGLSLLDVGCGGGLLCEPMARLGATVTGIDADLQAVELASNHAKSMNLDIKYLNHTTTEMVDKKQTFDVVLGLEIIEHVTDPELFIQECSSLLKPGGCMVLSTLNRTWLSYLGGIVVAERILRIIPGGTHTWEKFLKPSEINKILGKHELKLVNLQGMSFNPLKQNWFLSENLSINYICFITKG